MIIRTLLLAAALAFAAAALAQEPVGRDWVATMRLDALTEDDWANARAGFGDDDLATE